MAVAVLSDDAALFSKAASLFTATTTNYLRWGRDPNANTGRTLGECTETLRVGTALRPLWPQAVAVFLKTWQEYHPRQCHDSNACFLGCLPHAGPQFLRTCCVLASLYCCVCLCAPCRTSTTQSLGSGGFCRLLRWRGSRMWTCTPQTAGHLWRPWSCMRASSMHGTGAGMSPCCHPASSSLTHPCPQHPTAPSGECVDTGGG